jgi:hypothetical protein
MKTIDREWRKSTRSANQANCVEVRSTLDRVRDSKNPTGPTLAVNVTGLVAAIRDGRIG